MRSEAGLGIYRIGSVPHRLRRRPPSAIAITTRISSGRGAAATETVIVSKCGNDQESSLCPSGTSSKAPAAATLTFDRITAFPPPIAEHRMDARTAVFHFARDANNSAFAVGDCGSV